MLVPFALPYEPSSLAMNLSELLTLSTHVYVIQITVKQKNLMLEHHILKLQCLEVQILLGFCIGALLHLLVLCFLAQNPRNITKYKE